MPETILTGRLEDSLGRQFHPETAADLVLMDDGSTVAEKIQEFIDGDGVNISQQNLNNLTANGFYVGSNLQNAPFANTNWWYIINRNLLGDSSCVNQIAIGVYNNVIYSRIKVNANWTGWVRLSTIVADGSEAYIPIYLGGPESNPSGYIGYVTNNQTLEVKNNRSGGSINLITDGGLQVNGSRLPTHYASTAAPTSAEGSDGDVWDVYV